MVGLVLSVAAPAWAVQRLTVPSGTVIPLRMETYLSSESSKVGDRFTATVFRDVIVDGWVVVPVNSKVEGRVTSVSPSNRISKAGTIGVGFDGLIYPDGRRQQIDGTLTALDEEARRRLEDDIDEESRVEGGDRSRRAVVFIGGGAGAGAIIGAVAGGGKGAAVGAGIGAVLGTVGVLLSKGDKAEVEPGSEFGMRIERSFVAEARRREDRYDDDYARQSFTSTDAITFAQMVLRDRGYYSGSVDGVMSASTRNALRGFQRDFNIPVSGEIDLRTARALGMAGSDGDLGELIAIRTATAQRTGRDSLRVNVVATTRSGGWEPSLHAFTSGSTLHVYVRGVPPRVPSTMAITDHQMGETYQDAARLTRVIFHGSGRDLTVDLGGDVAQGRPREAAGDTRQIEFLSNRLWNDFRRDLNVRSREDQLTFDQGRNFRENEAELLVHIRSLAAAASLYHQLVTAVDDYNAIKGAADSLLRQARLVNRVIKRNDGRWVSSLVKADWDQLRAELERIRITETNVDSDQER